MKKHKLAKNALKHPELFSPAELAYFELWLRFRKERKSGLRTQKEPYNQTSHTHNE